MVSITLSVPEELKRKMEEFPEMNWSEVARQAISRKMQQLEFMKHFASGSELTEDDAIRLGKKVSKAVAKRFRETK